MTIPLSTYIGHAMHGFRECSVTMVRYRTGRDVGRAAVT